MRRRQFLLEEMRESPYGPCRVAAARGLSRLGNKDAMPAMLALWESLAGRPAADDKPAFPPVEGPPEDGRECARDLIWYLAAHGDATAIESLARHAGLYSVDLRMNIVAGCLDRLPGGTAQGPSAVIASGASEASADSPGETAGAAQGPSGGRPPDEAAAAQARLVAKTAEKVVVAMMDDTEQREGESGSLGGGKSFIDPRVCDHAAYYLAQKLPKKYEFDMTAPLRERDRQRVAMINVWRKEQNLPLVSLPEPKRIAPAPPETTTPLLEKIVAAKAAEQRKAAIAELQKLGLPALPAVRRRLAALDARHDARADLESLAARLASIVNEIAFTDRSDGRTESLRRTLEQFKGVSLTGDGYVSVVLAVANDLTAGLHRTQGVGHPRTATTRASRFAWN